MTDKRRPLTKAEIGFAIYGAEILPGEEEERIFRAAEAAHGIQAMKAHITPGSSVHFALIGAPWHFNLLRGQEHADMMAFARAVWDAALASVAVAEPATALVRTVLDEAGEGR